MAVDMPARYGDVDLCLGLDSHFFGKICHALMQVLRPLAGYIVCNNNSTEHDANESRENYEIHVTITTKKRVSTNSSKL